MLVTLTLVDPIGSAVPVDVEVSATPGAQLTTARHGLLQAIDRRDGVLFCGGRALDGTEPLGEPPLVDGAVLTVDRADHREPPGLLELHVLAGPDAGAVHRLGPGEHGIGRAVEARVRVEDPDVSRLHAVLRVALDDADTTTVLDLGSTNGTTLDGVPVTRDGSSLLPGQMLRIGDTRLGLALPETVPVSCRPDGSGHLELNRPPRHVQAPTPVRVTMPLEPAARERSRFPLLAMAVPMVAGLVLVAVMRSPAYLLFVLLSPLMMLGTWLGDRSSGRRSRRAQEAEHTDAVARCRAAVDRAVADESAARHRAHPSAADLLLCATGPRPRLWERRREDPDFLEVRLGLGTVAAAAEVRTPARPGQPETTHQPDLVDVPVTVSLAAAGVVGLAGPRNQVLALARSVAAQLAGWHSPRHVSLVVLSADPGRDWEWTRWLPHLRSTSGEASSVLVGNDPGQVRARVDELFAALDASPSVDVSTKALDDLVSLAEHSVRVGKQVVVGDTLYGV
ncbi:MAG: FHA domain-containing protein, partial [Actinomycetes bacterium]